MVFGKDTAKLELDANAHGPTVACRPIDLDFLSSLWMPTVTTFALEVTEFDVHYLHQVLCNLKQKFQSLRTVEIMWYSRQRICDKCFRKMQDLANVENFLVVSVFAKRKKCAHLIEVTLSSLGSDPFSAVLLSKTLPSANLPTISNLHRDGYIAIVICDAPSLTPFGRYKL